MRRVFLSAASTTTRLGALRAPARGISRVLLHGPNHNQIVSKVTTQHPSECTHGNVTTTQQRFVGSSGGQSHDGVTKNELRDSTFIFDLATSCSVSMDKYSKMMLYPNGLCRFVLPIDVEWPAQHVSWRIEYNCLTQKPTDVEFFAGFQMLGNDQNTKGVMGVEARDWWLQQLTNEPKGIVKVDLDIQPQSLRGLMRLENTKTNDVFSVEIVYPEHMIGPSNGPLVCRPCVGFRDVAVNMTGYAISVSYKGSREPFEGEYWGPNYEPPTTPNVSVPKAPSHPAPSSAPPTPAPPAPPAPTPTPPPPPPPRANTGTASASASTNSANSASSASTSTAEEIKCSTNNSKYKTSKWCDYQQQPYYTGKWRFCGDHKDKDSKDKKRRRFRRRVILVGGFVALWYFFHKRRCNACNGQVPPNGQNPRGGCCWKRGHTNGGPQTPPPSVPPHPTNSNNQVTPSTPLAPTARMGSMTAIQPAEPVGVTLSDAAIQPPTPTMTEIPIQVVPKDQSLSQEACALAPLDVHDHWREAERRSGVARKITVGALVVVLPVTFGLAGCVGAVILLANELRSD